MTFFEFLVPFLEVLQLNFLKLNLLDMNGNLILVVALHGLFGFLN